MIKVTFDKKLTEQFENYGEVLKWISDQLSSNSISDDSDDRVKLELLTQEEVEFLADNTCDQKGVWAEALKEYGHFGYAVFNGDSTLVDVISNISYFTRADVLAYLDACGISELFDISEIDICGIYE